MNSPHCQTGNIFPTTHIQLFHSHGNTQCMDNCLTLPLAHVDVQRYV